MKFSKEFKEAITHLSSREKDKLLFRLLKKDLLLANRLNFELVSTKTVDEKRAELETHIISKVEGFSNRFYSTGYLNMYARYLSGDITEHVKITKDKLGEISLNILLLTEILKRNNANIVSETPAKARKFCIAVIARIFKILMLIDKIEEDYRLEFMDDLKELGILFADNPYLMKNAIYNGLDINWLIQQSIPINIVEQYKELRANGFIR